MIVLVFTDNEKIFVFSKLFKSLRVNLELSKFLFREFCIV